MTFWAAKTGNMSSSQDLSKNRRYAAVFILLIAALVVAAFISIMLGTVRMGVSEVFAAISGGGDDIGRSVIMSIRLPRIASAIILGGALALSGYMLQTFFDNPIVGPFVLGISSGAKLTVALFLIFFLSRGGRVSSMWMVGAAFLGAMIAMSFVLLISVRVRSMGILVVCGIMTGYICSAITDLVVTFADDSNIVNLHNWSMGSLSGTSSRDVKMMAVIVLACVITAFFMSKPIGAYRLGEAYARSAGVNITLLRVMLILVSSLLAAVVTAFAGPISFVGIAIPHLVKGLMKTSDPIVMIPGCLLMGALVTLVCDGFARMLFAPTEVSISSVTAVFLVPVVITVMLRRRRES